MVESLKCLRRFDEICVVIVSNGLKSDQSTIPSSYLSPLENLSIVNSDKNRGYFGGLKMGLEWFRKTHGGLPSWIIACNNDIRIEQTDFFEKLSRLEHGNVGVIAPEIICSETGLDQNPFMLRRPGRWRIGELHFWLRSYYLAFIHEEMSLWKSRAEALRRRFLRKSEEPCKKPGARIYAAHGAFLIFSRQFFELGGFLDDGFFLFHEEISIAEICWKLGLAIFYHPQLSILHDEHSTIGRRFTRTTYLYQKQSFHHLMANYLTDLI
jgi:GT2 family glycosyltransferase